VSAPRFAFLGTAGALASGARDNTSIVVEAGGAAVLLDCGGAAVHRLYRLGVDPLALTHVVIDGGEPRHGPPHTRAYATYARGRVAPPGCSGSRGGG